MPAIYYGSYKLGAFLLVAYVVLRWAPEASVPVAVAASKARRRGSVGALVLTVIAITPMISAFRNRANPSATWRQNPYAPRAGTMR